jgi:hypothetical protein
MNTGQMMLTIGALVLLSVTVLSVNRTNLQQGFFLRRTEIGIYAISLATSMIEEAAGMDFDEVTINSAVTTPTSMTAPASLGPEAGEVYRGSSSATTFDDFDDFLYFKNNPYKYGANGVDSFYIKTNLYYVDPANPNANAGVRTYCKVLNVFVTSTSMARDTIFDKPDTLKMSYVFSYFRFR